MRYYLQKQQAEAHRRIADLFYGLGMLAGALLIAVLVWASIEHSGHAGGRALSSVWSVSVWG